MLFSNSYEYVEILHDWKCNAEISEKYNWSIISELGYRLYKQWYTFVIILINGK